jgi:hypothetical protein
MSCSCPSGLHYGGGGCGCSSLLMSSSSLPIEKQQQQHYGGRQQAAKRRRSSSPYSSVLLDYMAPNKRRGSSPARKRRRSPSSSSATTTRRKRKSVYDSVVQAAQEKNKLYFTHQGRGMSEPVKKYCRCLADVSAKQSAECLIQEGGTTSRRGKKKTCYNPYAICGRIKPKSMGGSGCARFYNYSTMPQAQKKAVADLHHKTIRQLVEAARQEAEHAKWD